MGKIKWYENLWYAVTGFFVVLLMHRILGRIHDGANGWVKEV